MLPFIFLNYIEPLHSQLGDKFEVWKDRSASLVLSPNFYVPIMTLSFLYILLGIFLRSTDKKDPDFDSAERDRLFLKRILSPILRHHRFFLVLLISICQLTIIYYFWADLKRINAEFGGDKPNWLGTIITTAIAAPIAFAIWTFRNTDKRQDILHAEENIRQTDFHKIEEWATTFSTVIAKKNYFTTIIKKIIFWGKITDKIDLNTLQIAAIYQLLPYLKGEHGERFVRPSMEIYRSLLSSWELDIKDKIIERKVRISELEKPNYINSLHTIFRQEVHFFRKFHEQSVCRKNDWIPLKKIDLKGADLYGLHLLKTNLSEANLSKANLRWANLSKADLSKADLRGADFSGANLIGADLREAKLSWATYEDEKIERARVNENTILKNGRYWKPPKDNSDQKPG